VGRRWEGRAQSQGCVGGVTSDRKGARGGRRRAHAMRHQRRGKGESGGSREGCERGGVGLEEWGGKRRRGRGKAIGER